MPRSLLAALTLLLVPATPAVAASPSPGEVTATGTQFLYQARGNGEKNNVVVTQSGNDVTLSDSGSAGITITAGSVACTQSSPTSVTCPTQPDWVLGIDVGNGADTVTVDSRLGAKILGGEGDDVLDGGDAADMIGGANGDDVIRGDGGADTRGGNSGAATIDYSTSLQPVTVTPDANADDGALGEGDFVQDTFENVRGSANGDDLTANAAGGTVDGDGGADTLRGGPGADVLRGGEGDDRVLSVDTVADQLACGDGADSAEADEIDVISGDCETVTYPPRPVPADGSASPGDERTTEGAPPRVSAVAGERASGRVFITVGGKTRELKADEAIPPSAVVDTRAGAITLTAVPDAAGKVAKATFNGGRVRVGRSHDARPLTALSLAGPAPVCPTARKASAAKAGKPKTRRLWGSGHGRFRTRGKYASAAVRGTIWLTEDRCDGTLVKVKRGLVAVRDVRRKKTVMVPVGKQYLARAR